MKKKILNTHVTCVFVPHIFQYHWIALNQFELPRQPPRPVLHVQSKSQPSVKKTMPHKLNSRLTVVPKRSVFF